MFFLHSLVNSLLWAPNVSLSALFSNTLGLCFSVWETKFHTRIQEEAALCYSAHRIVV
jgi:hypothetical protein